MQVYFAPLGSVDHYRYPKSSTVLMYNHLIFHAWPILLYIVHTFFDLYNFLNIFYTFFNRQKHLRLLFLL